MRAQAETACHGTVKGPGGKKGPLHSHIHSLIHSLLLMVIYSYYFSATYTHTPLTPTSLHSTLCYSISSLALSLHFSNLNCGPSLSLTYTQLTVTLHTHSSPLPLLENQEMHSMKM